MNKDVIMIWSCPKAELVYKLKNIKWYDNGMRNVYY